MKNILIAILICLPATAFSQVAKSNVSAGKLSAELDTKVSKSGDTMTGQLTTTSTLTVQGNAFSVGTSTFVVKEGNVGIGTTAPTKPLYVGGLFTGATYSGNLVGKFPVRIDNFSTPSGEMSGIEFRDSTTNMPAYGAIYTRSISGADGANAVGIATYSGGLFERLSISGNGTVTIPGSSFSVGTSTFVVKDGRVGIGVTSPTDHLSIAGNIRFSGIGGAAPYALLGQGAGNINGAAYANNMDGDGKYIVSAAASGITSTSGEFRVYTAASGTAGNAITWGDAKVTVLNGGNVGIGTTAPSVAFDINSDAYRVRTSSTITTATDACDAGTIRWDADFVFLCVAANTWKRAALATWP